jgi:Holliday junction resolvasome RuvABC endonuclease subunit
MRKTIGLDVSPLRIGWAILDTDELTDHGTIIFESTEWVTPSMRFDEIEQLADKHEVQRVGMEAVFVGPNKLGSIRAAMALGQVEMAADCVWPNADQKVLTAAQWRRLAGVEGGGKEPVMEWAANVCSSFGVDVPKMQDAADAIAIAYATYRWFDENESA